MAIETGFLHQGSSVSGRGEPQETMNSVCAVVVTFRPKSIVLENLAKVRPQVEGLVVVDNGSSTETLAPFRAAARDLNFTLIENKENLGIAAALNAGVQWAKSQNHDFVILFDQDSTVTEGYVGNMLSEYLSHPDRQEVAIVTSIQIEPGYGKTSDRTFDKDGNLLTATTSGSLIACHIFDRCGWFEDDFIIDSVDTEYCLRVRSMRFQIVLAQRATLFHLVGIPKYHFLAGKGPFRTSNHSAQRRYYMTRNLLVVIKRYWRVHPEWCRGMLKYLIRGAAIVALFERQRPSKFTNMARGVLDALLGRMGKVIEL
jgi:rhamnosyltransferase